MFAVLCRRDILLLSLPTRMHGTAAGDGTLTTRNSVFSSHTMMQAKVKWLGYSVLSDLLLGGIDKRGAVEDLARALGDVQCAVRLTIIQSLCPVTRKHHDVGVEVSQLFQRRRWQFVVEEC